MKKIFLLVAAWSLLSACVANGVPRSMTFVSTVCGEEVRGYTPLKIEYGDSFIRVKAKSKIWKKTEFRATLSPKRDSDDAINYDDVSVTITGKATDSPASDWISGTGTFNNTENQGHEILLGCVPNALPGKVYFFDVVVEEVGRLDPRAEVVK
jgi:hypothetical protein